MGFAPNRLHGIIQDMREKYVGECDMISAPMKSWSLDTLKSLIKEPYKSIGASYRSLRWPIEVNLE